MDHVDLLTADMDGTILNTEDIYTEASSQVLATYGKGRLTWDIKIDLQGRPGPEATKLLLKHYNLDVTPEHFMSQTAAVQQTMWHKSAFLPGALELLTYLKEKDIPIALGTSSNTVNYEHKTKHLLEGFELFEGHIVTGDDKRIPPGKGKPNPDIWLVCLESINARRREQGLEIIDITECLVFEDGIPGVVSGINATATVVWIPHPEALIELNGKEHTIIGEGGEIIKSLEDFDKDKYGL